MELTKEDGRLLVYHELFGWMELESHIVTKRRWMDCYTGIFLHIGTGKTYQMDWQQSSNENVEDGPFEYSEPKLIEVEEYQKTVTSYRPVLMAEGDKNDQ